MNPYTVKRPPEPPRTMPAGWHNDRGIWRYVGERSDLDARAGFKPDTSGRRGNVSSYRRRESMGITAQGIRNWAAFQGIDCPERGAIPHRVLDAFEASGWAA